MVLQRYLGVIQFGVTIILVVLCANNFFPAKSNLHQTTVHKCQVRQVRVVAAVVVVVLSVHVGQQPSNPTTRTNFRHNLLQRVAFHTWAEKREKKVKIKVKTSFFVEKKWRGSYTEELKKAREIWPKWWLDLRSRVQFSVRWSPYDIVCVYVYNNRGYVRKTQGVTKLDST